jgi:HEAT repeat protein
MLAGKDADRADTAAAILAAIGRPAVAALLGVFSSHDLAIRHRAFNALVAMAEDPAPELLMRLVPAEVWYVQRNVLAVLRERGDRAGIGPAKRLWPVAHGKVRVEILHYLHAAQDPEGLAYWEAAIDDKSQELAAAAARLLLRWPWPEAAGRLVARVQSMPAWQVGSDHHLELLRVLARCGDAEARRYVETLPGTLRALPWRSGRLRGELERLLRGGEPSISS